MWLTDINLLLILIRQSKLCGVEQRASLNPILGRAAITLGIGPHSSFVYEVITVRESTYNVHHDFSREEADDIFADLVIRDFFPCFMTVMPLAHTFQCFSFFLLFLIMCVLVCYFMCVLRVRLL